MRGGGSSSQNGQAVTCYQIRTRGQAGLLWDITQSFILGCFTLVCKSDNWVQTNTSTFIRLALQGLAYFDVYVVIQGTEISLAY
jgi:hypothetical protein